MQPRTSLQSHSYAVSLQMAGKKKKPQLFALHIPVSFNSFTHGMNGEECLAGQSQPVVCHL